MKITLATPLPLSALADMAGGTLLGGVTDRRTLTHICTDSREADGSTLFCAIRGERVDGHRYVAKAAALGCPAVLCEGEPEEDTPCAPILVPDTVEALGHMAAAYRETLPHLPVVAVTGSVGKTTTKEMLAAVLQTGFKLFKKEGNYNSTIGLPLSFLEIGKEAECAVLEMGMSGRGEIASMTAAVHPNIALITNIGSSHLELLGTRENIARAKLEIARGLPAGGILLVNGDEPLLAELGRNFGEDIPVIPEGIRTLRLSLDGAGNADYRVTRYRVENDGMVFDLSTPHGEWRELRIPALGEHLLWAGGYAAATGQLLGLSEEQVRAGLSTYAPAHMRQVIRAAGGVTVIEDCYNAAPESMRAALSVLELAAGTHRDGDPTAPLRRIAVLGDMKELGADTVALHRAVGVFAAGKDLDLLVTVGELGAEIARGALEAGMSPDSVRITGGPDTYPHTAAYLRSILRPGDYVLVKASRSMALESIAEALTTPAESP